MKNRRLQNITRDALAASHRRRAAMEAEDDDAFGESAAPPSGSGDDFNFVEGSATMPSLDDDPDDEFRYRRRPPSRRTSLRGATRIGLLCSSLSRLHARRAAACW